MPPSALIVTNLEALLIGRYGMIPSEMALDSDSSTLAQQEPQFLQDLLGRRTCRAFTQQPVDQADRTRLIAAAQSAPSKSNLQQYTIIRITESKLRAALGALVPTMPWIVEAPEFWIFCGDLRRIRSLALLRGHTYNNDNTDSFMNSCVDATAALMACIIAAEGFGYGVCPISYIRNQIDETSAMLALPPGVFPIVGLCLGRPAIKTAERPVSVRLPPALVLHENRYDDDNLAREIDAYDTRAHARQPISPEKQRHTESYGVLDYCRWSENVTRQLSLPERTNLTAYLQRQGISLK